MSLGHIINLIFICFGFTGLHANQHKLEASPEGGDGGDAPEVVWERLKITRRKNNLGT